MPKKNEYTMGEYKSQNTTMGRGPGRGMAGGEKATNFGKSISQLASYSKRYFPVMIVAVVFAVAGPF